VEEGAQAFARARLHFGHGTESAFDEAAWLAAHVLRLVLPIPRREWRQPVAARQAGRVRALFARRIARREPVAYLTGEAWFAGRPYHVNRHVLVPRSPFAELITARFRPWLRRAPRRILDLGTGSGCIAIACALAFPRAQVDAADISPQALAVARRNARRHEVESRLRCLRSDVFSGLADQRYDLIVSNPPYVPLREMRGLAAEYRHEPALALAAGADGLSIANRILAAAAGHLTDDGLLAVEVGQSAAALQRRHRRMPFIWPELMHGGDGIFLLERRSLLPGA
jgi:ribosomal protein L3 glutamine methyltransferase